MLSRWLDSTVTDIIPRNLYEKTDDILPMYYGKYNFSYYYHNDDYDKKANDINLIDTIENYNKNKINNNNNNNKEKKIIHPWLNDLEIQDSEYSDSDCNTDIGCTCDCTCDCACACDCACDCDIDLEDNNNKISLHFINNYIETYNNNQILIPPQSNRFHVNQLFKKIIDYVHDNNMNYQIYSETFNSYIKTDLIDISRKNNFYKFCYYYN